MASIIIPAREDAKAHPNLRPLNVLRDLPSVADLIELCFSETMDSDGRRYLQDMRRAGSDTSFLNWANRMAETTSLPLTGYIWEEDHRIVGNVSLVPFRQRGRRLYLIANVAAHPDYRRRGIARALTERAMQHAHDKKVDDLWLQVRADNPGAIQLYSTLGFVERARRTNWQATTDPHAKPLETDIAITNRTPRHWAAQLHWLSRLYPDALAWHSNWNLTSLKPGLLNWIYLMLLDSNIRQWSAVRKDELLATLSWIPTSRGSSLFAAAGGRSDPEALTQILIEARRDLYYQYPSIGLEFPVSRFDNAIQAAGFKPLRTLIWMQATSPVNLRS